MPCSTRKCGNGLFVKSVVKFIFRLVTTKILRSCSTLFYGVFFCLAYMTNKATNMIYSRFFLIPEQYKQAEIK